MTQSSCPKAKNGDGSWYCVYDTSEEALKVMYEHCGNCLDFTPEIKEQQCQHDPDTWDPKTCFRRWKKDD